MYSCAYTFSILPLPSISLSLSPLSIPPPLSPLSRLKKEVSTTSEELRGYKKRETGMEGELDSLRHELERTRPKLAQMSQYKQELHNLSEANQSLQSELASLQEHYDSILHEKDDLEQQTKEVYEALNEEREAKSILETKLQIDKFVTPNRVGVAGGVARLKRPLVSDDVVATSSVPTSPTAIQNSTPFTAHASNEMPSLLSELENSLLPPQETDHTHLMSELEDKNSLLVEEKEQLEKQVVAILSDIDKWKSKYQEVVHSHEAELSSLKDELEAKKEIVNQLNNKSNSLNREKVALEIEIEGLKDEITRIKESSQNQNEQLVKELTDEQTKSGDLKSRISEMEEKLTSALLKGERSEIILLQSRKELLLMKEGIHNLHRTINSLQQQQTQSKALQDNISNQDTYTLVIGEGEEGKKQSIVINRESQALVEVIQLRDLLQQVRAPLESFTKNMLQDSLKNSTEQPLHTNGITSNSGDTASLMNSPSQSPRKPPLSSNGIKLEDESLSAGRPNDNKELEGIVTKLRARLANRMEEVNQLRTIMKARQTTVEVTVSSLKSKLEGQARSHEAEIGQYKNKLKSLRKERDEQTSLCALTSKRCQEYLGEISKLKRKIDDARSESNRLRSEAKLLDVYLQRAIKQKLDISQKLERYQEEEERNRVIPLTLSASRV